MKILTAGNAVHNDSSAATQEQLTKYNPPTGITHQSKGMLTQPSSEMSKCTHRNLPALRAGKKNSCQHKGAFPWGCAQIRDIPQYNASPPAPNLMHVHVWGTHLT